MNMYLITLEVANVRIEFSFLEYACIDLHVHMVEILQNFYYLTTITLCNVCSHMTVRCAPSTLFMVRDRHGSMQSHTCSEVFTIIQDLKC